MTATMTAVATATAAVPRLYPLNSVPPSPTYPYGVYSAALGRGDGYSMAAEYGLRHGGVVLQTFGHTAAAALDLMDQSLAALLDKRLTADCTPLQADLDQPSVNRDPDDNGVVTVTMPLSFTQET